MKRPFLIGLLLVTSGSTISIFQNCAGGLQTRQIMENIGLGDMIHGPDGDAMTEEPDQPVHALNSKAATAAKVCSAAGLVFKWPVPGVPYKDWAIANYVDDDRLVGTMLDYSGASGSAARTYDNHKGIDILVPSFRYMDANFPVLAAADGVVEGTNASSFDRNTVCSTDLWNYVKIRHANGFVSYYGHLKKNSVIVQIGQAVKAGDTLGVVGSSGCSRYPHLHFEVQDCNKVLIDPAQAGMFLNLPLYQPTAPAALMDTVIRQPVFTSSAIMVDPGPSEPSFVLAGQAFSIGLTVSNVKVGEPMGVDLTAPSGIKKVLQTSSTLPYALAHRWVNPTLTEKGIWRLQFKVNGVIQQERTLEVR